MNPFPNQDLILSTASLVCIKIYQFPLNSQLEKEGQILPVNDDLSVTCTQSSSHPQSHCLISVLHIFLCFVTEKLEQ